jgi:hypothetical protein
MTSQAGDAILMDSIVPFESYEYRLWGQVLVSDLDLGLSDTSSDRGRSGHIRIQRIPRTHLHELSRTESLECPNEDGSIWLTISRSNSLYVLDFPGVCSIQIDSNVPLIEYAPEPGVGTSTIVHLLLDHALPRLVSLLNGYFVLHASAWVIQNDAIVLLGESGAGKSTLASWFGTQGFPIVTDDCLVLHWDPHDGEWMALPSYPSVRLWPDSIDGIGINPSGLREFAHYSAKRRTNETHDNLCFATSPVHLGAAFVLKSGDHGPCLVEPCPVNDAFGALSLGVFRLEIASTKTNRREFEILTDLVEKIPFWSVSHGNDYTLLPEIQQRMLDVLR